MEAKMEMELLDLEDNDDRQLSSEASLPSDGIYDDAPVCPCIGSEHQAEIPNLATEDERRELMTSSPNGYGYPAVVGLALPIMWVSSTEVNGKEEELHMQKKSEIEARATSRDEESLMASVCPTSNNTMRCDLTYQDPHTVVSIIQTESDSNTAHDEKLTPCPTQGGINFTNNPMMQQRATQQLNPLPYSPAAIWSDLEVELFLLGLYIFGKNLNLLSRFLGTKTVGDVLSYYYGKFYMRDAYKRWSDCRKAKTKRCILGERIFQGWRQQELISRLKSKIPIEAHNSLIEVFKSFSDSQVSFEGFVFALKSIVGIEAFVEAVGIGKGKHDLAGFILEQPKPNQASFHPDLPTGKDCSSLTLEDIIKFLTGDFRRSKTRSNDIFWEAVWPRLLAKGWHSEQPKDVSTTKNSLVFLVAGIKKFSRSKLTKGTHYFDSVSDVLKKVAADPALLDLEADGIGNGFTDEKNGNTTDVKLKQDSPLNRNQESPLMFTIIDTTLVEGEEPSSIRELRSLPADANISFDLPRHSSSNMLSDSSSEEQDASDRLSDDHEDHGRVTEDVKDVEMVSAGSLQDVITANGHSANGNNDKVDLTSIYSPKTKTERRKYLSPVSKRRKLASCSNELTSRRVFSFSKGSGLEKEKGKPPLTSSKPAPVDLGGTFQTKTIAGCSTKEKSSEQKTDASNSAIDGGPNWKKSMANTIENKSSQCKVNAVAKVHSNTTVEETKIAKERGLGSGLVNSNKLERQHDDKQSGSICAASSYNHGVMNTDEAPSISNSNVACDPLDDAAGGPVNPQPELPEQANPRRLGTRKRPPTARALEAVAFGLLGSGNKRKGDPKNTVTNRPSQRARKTSKGPGSVSMAASGDAEKFSSSMDAEAKR